MSQLSLIDHHCHGIVADGLDRTRFQALMSEGHAYGQATDHFFKPLGLAIRRYCAPVLGLEPLCDSETYLSKRLGLGLEADRLLLQAADVDIQLIDTGHRSSAILEPSPMASLTNRQALEIARIEAIMEEVGRSCGDVSEFLSTFPTVLDQRLENAVGAKSIVAYRATFAIEQRAPDKNAVQQAAERWFRGAPTAAERARVEDPILLMHGLWVAAEICRADAKPIQLHVGFGDRDVIMHACDPTHFTPFIRDMEKWKVPITLLHNYPFVREAAWLAEVYANVYYDVGAILNFTGPSAARTLRDALEMGPFWKQLYSSDAFGLSELHLLGAIQFRTSLEKILSEWCAEGWCTLKDAASIARAIGSDNARELYRLN